MEARDGEAGPSLNRRGAAPAYTEAAAISNPVFNQPLAAQGGAIAGAEAAQQEWANPDGRPWRDNAVSQWGDSAFDPHLGEPSELGGSSRASSLQPGARLLSTESDIGGVARTDSNGRNLRADSFAYDETLAQVAHEPAAGRRSPRRRGTRVLDVHRASPYQGPLDTDTDHPPIRWESNDFLERTSQVVVAPVGAKAKIIVKRLKLQKSYPRPDGEPDYCGYRGVLHIIGNGPALDEFLAQGPNADPLPEGLDKDEAMVRMKLLFTRGIVAAAIAVQAVCVTSGVDVGEASMAGRANAGWNHKMPLIAVAPKRRVRWPGDPRPGKSDRAPLQRDHTHVVLVDSLGDTDIQHTCQFRFNLSCRLAGWSSKRNAKHMPAVVFLINGDQEELHETLRFVHLGWPIVVVRGTGGMADMIALAKKEPHTFFSNEKLMEVVSDGNIEVMELGEVDGMVTRQMVQRLFSTRDPDAMTGNISPAVARAWEYVHVYESNADTERLRGLFFRNWILLLGVAATTLAVLANELNGNANFVKSLGMQSLTAKQYTDYTALLTCLPIATGVFVAMDNRFRSINKWRVLTVASDTIRSEIYRWRTNCGDYGSASISERNKLLAKKCSQVADEVLNTVVIEGALAVGAALAAKERHYAVSKIDDGFCNLTPDDYVKLRILPQMEFFKMRAAEAQSGLLRFQVAIYIIGGMGTILATFRLDILVAITTAVSSALNTLIEKEQYGEALHVYNFARTEVTNVMNWWNALSPVEQANPQRYATLVSTIEAVKMSECNFLLPGVNQKGETNQIMLGKQLELDQLKQDILDNMSNGKIHFLNTWTEKHRVFFGTYEDWLRTQGIYEDIAPNDAEVAAAGTQPLRLTN